MESVFFSRRDADVKNYDRARVILRSGWAFPLWRQTFQKANPRPHLPVRSGEPVPGARSKLGAPARSSRLPASVLRPSAALNAVAGRDAEPRPLLGAPAPRCRHTEALWPPAPPHWQCARKAAPLSANVCRRRRRCRSLSRPIALPTTSRTKSVRGARQTAQAAW